MKTLKINNIDYIRCDVIMIPHEKANSSLCMYHTDGMNELSTNIDKLKPHTNQVLFILTTESGKWGDMCFEHYKEYNCSHLRYPADEKNHSWFLREANMNWSENDEYCKRVVASSGYLENSPKISDAWLSEYTKQWNGSGITDAYIEYDVSSSQVKIVDNCVNIIFHKVRI